MTRETSGPPDRGLVVEDAARLRRDGRREPSRGLAGATGPGSLDRRGGAEVARPRHARSGTEPDAVVPKDTSFAATGPGIMGRTPRRA
ncbi:hypothetical protein I6A81_25380 [Frankia sp. CN7]|nr:hypothetical protein [Frankia nepalensis]